MIDLSDRTALVTGGGQGVGRAIAVILAAQGADVAIGDIDAVHAAETAREIERLGRRALVLRLDVSSRSSAVAAVDQIVSEWGKIDILVNNAGVVSAPDRPGEDEDLDFAWDFVLGVNLRGVVNCTDAVMPYMADARYGKIVNIASTAGKPGDPVAAVAGPAPPGERPSLGGSAYAASKAAVLRHTQIVAGGAARFNINVNAVCPSRMITPMGIDISARIQAANPDLSGEDPLELRRKAVLQVNRFGRELEPVDVARLVAFLASDDARNITGQSINVDGGFKMV